MALARSQRSLQVPCSFLARQPASGDTAMAAQPRVGPQLPHLPGRAAERTEGRWVRVPRPLPSWESGSEFPEPTRGWFPWSCWCPAPITLPGELTLNLVPPIRPPGSTAAMHIGPSEKLSDQDKKKVAKRTPIWSPGRQEKDHKLPANNWLVFTEHSNGWSGWSWRGGAEKNLTWACSPFTYTRPIFRQQRIQAA